MRGSFDDLFTANRYTSGESTNGGKMSMSTLKLMAEESILGKLGEAVSEEKHEVLAVKIL